MNPALILIYAGGYLIGTFPTAYLLTRMLSKQDIREHGTGNVGAHNAYDVTGKRWVGFATMGIDALKGVLTVVLAQALFPGWFGATAWAAIGCVVGHNFNIFLRGKGGRGLATAMGVGLVVNPAMVVTWWLMYMMGYYVISRNVHVGSMTGVLATGVLMFSLPDLVFQELTLVPFEAVLDVRIFAVGVLVPLFIRHLEPIRALIRESDAADV